MSSQIVPNPSELFTSRQLIERHPNFLNPPRLAWGLRHRASNGLTESGAVFDSKGGEILIHEPKFLEWFLGLSGRKKPRRARRSSVAA